MAIIKQLSGSDTLKVMYPKVNENFENLNNESADLQLQITENNQDRIDDLEAHKTSTDHPATKITYSGKINKSNVKEALDDTKDRIDNIVTSSGTSNTEIVDARQSTVKSKTFANVRARLEEIENEFKVNVLDKKLPIPQDYKTPGNEFLLSGDLNAGFAGFVQPSEMGKIGTSGLDFNGTNLALEIGLSGGTAVNSDTAWIKYVYKNKVCFRPIKPIRHSVAWNQLYNAGIVYPTQDEGLLPPSGRMGRQLSISATDNSINTTTLIVDAVQGFLRTDATVANVGDVVTLKGWNNPANNGDFTVVSITANKIVLSGGTLVNESNNKLGRIFKKSLAVTQGKVIKVGGLDFRVRLMRGASNDPLDSYDHADRDSIGVDNEWNAIILPLHSKAKLQNWAYPAYAGTTQYWGTDLTDADLITHYTFGAGNYAWCQETRDGEESYRRVGRGHFGASYLLADPSWFAYSHLGWLPVLELV